MEDSLAVGGVEDFVFIDMEGGGLDGEKEGEEEKKGVESWVGESGG